MEQAAEPEPLLEAPSGPARSRRALTLIVTSLVAISATGVTYLHPSLPGSASQVRSAVSATSQAGYQLAAVDFVSPASGWVVATFDSGDFTVLHTADAGDHWVRQLSGPTTGHGPYIHFFDGSRGLFALIGGRPLMYWTTDGGQSWRSQAALSAGAAVLSLSFVDPDHGWMLVLRNPSKATSVELFRTEDGGTSWTNLGQPTLASDQPYRVQFADRTTGWLDSLSASPYAYRSVDAGSSWQLVPLPAPPGGWLKGGQFFVAARPTQGFGVVATVVSFPPSTGRSGVGGTITWYPPLTLRTFDGGAQVSYTYSTLVDEVNGGPQQPVQAPNQVQLGSLDGGATWSAIGPPSDQGSIGYSDAQNWWWIGSGSWSKSSDGGTTWSPYHNAGVPQPLTGSLQVLDRSHAWFGAMAGPRPLLEATNDGGEHWRMVLLPSITSFGANEPG